MENPLCSIPWVISLASGLTCPENPEAMKETPRVRYSSRGFSWDSILPKGVELVISPSLVVGELWPLVSPYTPLSMITAQMFRLRAA